MKEIIQFMLEHLQILSVIGIGYIAAALINAVFSYLINQQKIKSEEGQNRSSRRREIVRDIIQAGYKMISLYNKPKCDEAKLYLTYLNGTAGFSELRLLANKPLQLSNIKNFENLFDELYRDRYLRVHPIDPNRIWGYKDKLNILLENCSFGLS